MSLNEVVAHRRSFLEGLVRRGLEGVQLIISDDHAGIEAACKAIFSGVPLLWALRGAEMPVSPAAECPVLCA